MHYNMERAQTPRREFTLTFIPDPLSNTLAMGEALASVLLNLRCVVS